MQVLLIIGATFLFVGTKVLIAQISLRKQSSSIVSGSVIGYEKIKVRRRNGGYRFAGYSYAPIFEYHYDGITRQVSHSFSTNSEKWLDENFPKGMSVELLVYENDADNAILNTKSGLNAQVILSTILTIIGAISLVVWGYALLF